MRRALSATAILAVLAGVLALPPSAMAIGFDRSINRTVLGQPLDFAAVLRVEGDGSLRRDCIAADVRSGDNRIPGAAVRVTLQPGASAGEQLVRVTTSVSIDEPVVTVDVIVGCGAQFTRTFTAFVDPPTLNLAQAAADPLPPQRTESSVAPVVEAVRDAAPRAAPAARSAAGERPTEGAAPRAERARPAATVAPRAAAPAPERPRRTASASARPRSTGPRLQLDAMAPVRAVPATRRQAQPTATVASAPTPAAPAAVAAVPAPAAASAIEVVAGPAEAASAASAPPAVAPATAAAASAPAEADARIAGLEQTLQRMRAEAEATQATLAALRAELQSAQRGDDSPQPVWLLAALSALLALTVVGLLWRDRRQREAPHWWAPEPVVPPSAAAASDPGAAVAAPAPGDLTERDTQAEVHAPPEASASGTAPVQAQPGLPRRELSVEELIDLEQQADFFTVLGQDEAAIDLLMSHVRSSGGTSPLPYLKLMEIYTRRGDREAYARERERFNQRFNAYAPEFSGQPQDGRSLEDYPDVMQLLQAKWSRPPAVMELMDSLVFRRGETSPTFDLGAYRELLFLYSIARDLAQHPVASQNQWSGAEDTLPLLTNEPDAYRPTQQPAMSVIDIDLSQPLPVADFAGLIGTGRRPDGS